MSQWIMLRLPSRTVAVFKLLFAPVDTINHRVAIQGWNPFVALAPAANANQNKIIKFTKKIINFIIKLITL